MSTNFDLLEIERHHSSLSATRAWRQGFFAGIPFGILVAVAAVWVATRLIG